MIVISFTGVITTSDLAPTVMESSLVGSAKENSTPTACAVFHQTASIAPFTNQVLAAVDVSLNSTFIQPLPRIFCADSDPEEEEENHTAPSYPQSDLNSLSTPNDPLATFALTSNTDFPQLKSPVLVHNPTSTIQLPVTNPDPTPGPQQQSVGEQQFVERHAGQKQLNVEATAWYPKDHGKSTQEFSSRLGRTLPQSFQPIYNFDAPDDDSNSWRTVNSAEEDKEEEDSDREDSIEEFLDSQYVRDDSYLDERRNRQVRRERDTILMRRGRGRPLGSRNITFFDADFPTTTRQSSRSNKGVPPQYYEPGL